MTDDRPNASRRPGDPPQEWPDDSPDINLDGLTDEACPFCVSAATLSVRALHLNLTSASMKLPTFDLSELAKETDCRCSSRRLGT